jgi:multidrug resistance efflux pump
MRGKWLLFAGITILAAVAAGALQLYRQSARKPVATAPAAPASQVLGNELSITGTIEAQQTVDIAAPIDGVVDSFGAEIGQDVFEGQLIAHIRNTRLDAAVEGAQLEAERMLARVQELEAAIVSARLEASRATADASRSRSEFDRADKVYQRQSLLIREGATPRLAFEKAEREYRAVKDEFDSKDRLATAAQERIESLNRELDATKKTQQERDQALDTARQQVASGDVHSPVDGIVLGRRGAPGEEVDPTMEDFFRIAVTLSSLQVTVQPEPPALARIKAGQPASIHVAEVPDEIAGTVREIKDGRVIVEFTSPTAAIRPATTAQVRIKLS